MLSLTDDTGRVLLVLSRWLIKKTSTTLLQKNLLSESPWHSWLPHYTHPHLTGCAITQSCIPAMAHHFQMKVRWLKWLHRFLGTEAGSKMSHRVTKMDGLLRQRLMKCLPQRQSTTKTDGLSHPCNYSETVSPPLRREDIWSFLIHKKAHNESLGVISLCQKIKDMSFAN